MVAAVAVTAAADSADLSRAVTWEECSSATLLSNLTAWPLPTCTLSLTAAAEATRPVELPHTAHLLSRVRQTTD